MTKREILNLKIKCDEQQDGCEWIGELRERDEHNQTCGYVVVPCDNDCNEMVMRKDRKHHKENLCCRRIVGCSYCDVQMEYQEISVHFETCTKYPVSCHYECGMQIPRGEMDVHASREGSCSKSPLECDFAGAGCQFSGNRRQLQDHLEQNTVSHLSLVMRSLHTTTERLAISDARLAASEERLTASDARLAASEERLTASDARLAASEERLAASDERQKKLIKKLTHTEYAHNALAKELEGTHTALKGREFELESVKAFLSLEFESSQVLKWLLEDGTEKSMKSSTFLQSALGHKNELLFKTSGNVFFIWKVATQPMQKTDSIFYTGKPGWRLNITTEIKPTETKPRRYFSSKLSDMMEVSDMMKVSIYRLKGDYDEMLPQSRVSLSVTLINQDSGRNLSGNSVCELARPYVSGLRKLLKQPSLEDYKILMAFCKPYSNQGFKNNNELLLTFQFKVL
jgi:hypothetical protein